MSKGKGNGSKGEPPKAGPAQPQAGRKPAMPTAPRMMQRKASARGR